MKTAYKIFLTALSIAVLAWFLPWLYSLIFPVGGSDPFVAYSPVTDSFIVSENSDGKTGIYEVDNNNTPTGRKFTREERDSLLPQIYFTQLVAHEKLPDTINGIEVSIPIFKHSQWVFNSIPHDVNKKGAEVYLMMESMPARVDLEDPKEAFRLNGKVEFIDIATNTVNPKRSSRFTEVFKARGFSYPAKRLNANITTRKQYDEGYLIIDSEGSLYHVKMQAGRPYMVKVQQPEGMVAEYVFILENPDTRPLGLVTDSDNNLYVLEHEGYKLKQLPVGKVNPELNKLTVVKNLFNWVVKISSTTGSRWVAIDSSDYSQLGTFETSYQDSTEETIAGYIFPFELSFTSTMTSLAYPRIDFLSWHFILLNFALAVVIVAIKRCRSRKEMGIAGVTTLIFGIFAFIPLIFIKD
ncbi:MAG: DUF4857 domain-containing protein [Duncaniella sp.]|nr:DUF4857 domain-containing protein [Duncaniella sp.]